MSSKFRMIEIIAIHHASGKEIKRVKLNPLNIESIAPCGHLENDPISLITMASGDAYYTTANVEKQMMEIFNGVHHEN